MASASLNRKHDIIKQIPIGTSCGRWHGGNGQLDNRCHAVYVESLYRRTHPVRWLFWFQAVGRPFCHVGWHCSADMVTVASEEEDWDELAHGGPVGLLAPVDPPHGLDTTGPAEPLASAVPPDWADTGPAAPKALRKGRC